MKKTYIKPENTVLALNIERMICLSKNDDTEAVTNSTLRNGYGNGGDSYSRETVKSPDAWEEW